MALEISNLGGVYLVLGVGAVFGVFVSLLEMLLGVKERSKENKVERETFFRFSQNAFASVVIANTQTHTYTRTEIKTV